MHAPVLSPYEHELHYSGERCADDCPACRWAEDIAKEAALKLYKARLYLVRPSVKDIDRDAVEILFWAEYRVKAKV